MKLLKKMVLCAGLLFLSPVYGGTDPLLLHALLREKAPAKRLELALNILQGDPENRAARNEIRFLMRRSRPAERRQLAGELLIFAEPQSCPLPIFLEFVLYARESGLPAEQWRTACRKRISGMEPPQQGDSEQSIMDTLVLLDSTSYTPPFDLAANAPCYRKIWEAAPDLPKVKAFCIRFFFTASRLVPQDRRWFGLKRSESAEYDADYRTCFDRLARGNEEERFIAMDCACRAGDTEKALALMKTLPFGDPRLEEITIRERSGDRAGAIACCRRYLKENPKPFPQLQRKLAMMLFFNGEPAEAEHWAETAYRVQPKETALLLGLIYVSAGKFSPIAEIAKNLTPDEAIQLHIALLIRIGKYAGAADAAETYLKDHPHSLQTVCASLYPAIQHGKLTGTARKILRAMQTEGLLRDPRCANDLGYTLCLLGIDLDEAEKLLRYAYESAPLDPAAIDSLAFLRWKQGRIQEAWKLMCRALRLAPPDMEAGNRAELLGHAGDIALSLGRKTEALRFYREAVSLPELQLTPSARPAWRKRLDELTGSPSSRR